MCVKPSKKVIIPIESFNFQSDNTSIDSQLPYINIESLSRNRETRHVRKNVE